MLGLLRGCLGQVDSYGLHVVMIQVVELDLYGNSTGRSNGRTKWSLHDSGTMLSRGCRVVLFDARPPVRALRAINGGRRQTVPLSVHRYRVWTLQLERRFPGPVIVLAHLAPFKLLLGIVPSLQSLDHLLGAIGLRIDGKGAILVWGDAERAF